MAHMVQATDSLQDMPWQDRKAALTSEQKKARQQRRDALASRKQRKLDTRRKIILGGALVAMARKGNLDAKDMLQEIYFRLSEKDKSVFSDWLEKKD